MADLLSGAELREAARFAMRLVDEQARLTQDIVRLIDLGFPGLRAVWDDPTCTSALAVLRIAPTVRTAARKRIETLARANRVRDTGPSVGPRPSSSTACPADRRR